MQVPHIDKDHMLETLFNTEECRTLEVRSALSRQADSLLVAAADAHPQAVVSSWWRHPLSARASGTPIGWLSSRRRTVVEVHCQCPASVAHGRFQARQRHPGHLDGLRSPDELLAQFEDAEAHGALFPAHALLWRTDGQRDAPGVDELADRIRQRIAAMQER
jgi:glucokinase